MNLNEKSKVRILLIEDEKSVATFIRHSLEANGYVAIEAENGKSGIEKFTRERPDLVLLDFGLPDMTGLEVLKELRTWSKTPILFLTVRDSESDKIAALDAGADDYLTKPFNVGELLARLRVALRHAQSENTDPIFKSGVLEVDRTSRQVRLASHELKLTATEYALLCLLVQHAGKVVAHRTVLNEIWGPNSVEHHHYLRVYFGQIRKKMEAISPGAGAMIETESGVGYRLRQAEVENLG